MRTDIRGFHFEPFAQRWSNLPPLRTPPALPPDIYKDVVFDRDVDNAGFAMSVDEGRVGSERLDPALAEKGVLFGSLDRLLAEHDELLRPYLFAAVDYRADKFAALHAACWSGGSLLYVPKGVVIEQPFAPGLSPHAGRRRFRALADRARRRRRGDRSGRNQRPRRRIARAALRGDRNPRRPRARLRYVNLQNWGTGVWHFAHHRALVGQDASLQWTIGALGAGWRKSISTWRWSAPARTCRSTA